MLDRSPAPRRPGWAPSLAALVTLAAGLGVRPALGQDAWPDSAFLAEFRWRSIGPANFSGRITDVEGIPGTPVFYVAAATGGVWKTTNNGITFRPLFTDERVAAMGDLAIAPSDTSIVWAGTGEEDSRNSISPGGGVWKSTDGGLTWTHMGLDDTQAIGRIVIHPRNPDIVYVAALGHIWGPNEERGLYRTMDGGETWDRILSVSDRAGFVDIAMHPTDPDILFASSWERVRGPYFLESGGPGSALWKSVDGGDTWTEVSGGGFPETEKGRIGIAMSRSNPDIVYALVEARDPEEVEAAEGGAEADEPAEPDEEAGEAAPPGEEGPGTPGAAGGSGLYRSDDGGATWTWMNGENTRPFYYSQVRVDPSDPDFVIWSSTPVRFSKDGGLTVGQTTQGVHVDHHAIWWDTSNPDHIIVGSDGGIAITWDRGGNWDFPNTIPLGQFYAISYNMDVPYRICGGLQDNGTWCGPSRLRQGAITNYAWATVNGGDGFYALQDPVDPDIVYAESQGGSMARVDMSSGARVPLRTPDWREHTHELRDELVLLEDEAGDAPTAAQTARMDELRGRITRDSAAVELRFNWNTPMVLSPHDPKVVYAGANRVLKSGDRGEDFQPISPDLSYADSMKVRVSTETTGGITRDVTGAETYATVVALAESPLRAGWLYAGTDDGRVWRTKDDGGTWTELTDRFEGVPEGTWVSRIEPSSHDEERFYVTFDGHRSDDFTPYVLVTDDDGRSFRSIADGLPVGGPDFVHVIREDPENADLLFVGTDVGVYASPDRGASWRPFMNGLSTVPVHDLKIHPRDHELIAGTHGRSVWIIDIGPLEQVVGGRRLGDEVVLFDPAPGLQFGTPPMGGESTGHRTFRGENIRYGAEIVYYVPRAVSTALLREAREAREAAADAGGSTPRASSPQAEIVFLDSAGDTVQVLTGAITAGVRRVSWAFEPRSVTEPLSPAERRDSLDAVGTVRAVADSLIAAGLDTAQVEQAVENFGRRGRGGRGRFGGAATPRAPEFDERPGENYPSRPNTVPGGAARGGAAGGGAVSVNRAFFSALRERGVSFGGVRPSNRADDTVADPGTYTVVLRIGDRTLRTELEVVRAEGYEP